MSQNLENPAAVKPTPNYKNPVPVAVCLVPVVSESGVVRLLGHIRGIEPMIGGLALPGGYVDEGESAEQAAARELKEEIGIELQASDFRPLMTRTNGGNRMLVFCVSDVAISLMRYDNLDAPASPEVRAFKLIGPDTSKLCFPLHQEAAAVYFAAPGIPRRIL